MWLLEGFMRAVDKGDVNVLVGIDVYRETARDANSKLVGVTAANGTEITGYATHFIDRVIGQTSESHPGMRTGVPLEDVLDTLLNGTPGAVKVSAAGKQSQKIYGADNTVTVNPQTGLLIQTNPRKG